jgi:hypothetical protein
MKKQFFIIILLLMGGVSTFGQFKFDGGVNSVRLQTGGIDRLYIAPVGIALPVSAGNVGIGTIVPPAKLSVNGDMALQKILRETSAGGYNNYDRQDASIAIFQNGGTITGVQSGSEGQLLYILCGYGTNQSALTISHEGTGSTASNRILTHTGADFTITGGAGGVLLIYDATKARWRIVETPSGSGTAGWGLTGNSGTNPATQFIGTTDAQPLVIKTNNTEAMRVLSTGNVGIGTTTPDAKLDIAGDIMLSKKITITATANNLDRNGASVIKVTSNATITGIAGGVDGMMLHIYANTTVDLVLANSSGLSLVQNQIYTGSNADITITQGGGATLIYDGTSAHWRIIGLKD